MYKRILISSALLAVFLSSCVTMRLETRLKKDGSGSFVIVTAFDKQMIESMGKAQGVDMDDILSGLSGGPMPGMPNTRMEEFKEGDKQGFKIIVTFQDMADLQAQMQEMNLASSVSLTPEGEALIFRAFFDGNLMTQGLDSSQRAELEGLDLENMDLNELGIEFSYVVDVEGRVLDYAPREFGKARGGQVTWDLTKAPPEAQTMEFVVKWKPGDKADNKNVLLIVLLLAMGLVCLWIVYEVVRVFLDKRAAPGDEINL